MDPRLKVLYFFLDIVLPLIVGYALVRRAGVKEESFDWMVAARVILLGPVVALLSFWVIRLKLELIWLPVLGVAMQLVPGGVAFLRARTKFSDNLDRGSYVLSNMLRNRGVVGLLAVFILYGETGVAYCYLVMSLSPLVLYLLCFPMAGYYHATEQGEGAKRPPLKSILWSRNQIPILGVLAGLALNLSGLPRPVILGDIFPLILHTTFWVVVLPLGASMRFGEMKKYWLPVADSLVIKFVITPAVMLCLSFLVGLQAEALFTVVILSSSPTAINAVFVSKLFKLNLQLAMAAFLLTTAAYLVLVFPVIYVLV